MIAKFVVMVLYHQIYENFRETGNIYCNLDWLIIYHFCKLVNHHKRNLNDKDGVVDFVS